MKPKWTDEATVHVGSRELVTRLGEWTAGGGALYRRLAERLQTLIEHGELAAGAVLPPERLLARALAVSRTTVVGAYDLLREQALLESRQGSGTWVRGPSAERAPARPSTLPRASAMRGFMGVSNGTIDMLGAHLPGVEGVFTSALAAAQDDLVKLTRQPGYFPLGLPMLTRAIAQFLTRSGLPTRDDQVLPTSGAQQAISLVAAAFLQPGDTVVLEDPTYVGAMDAFRNVGARVVSVRVGPDGVSPAAVRDAVTRSSARLVYLMPTYQNPTSSVMPETRRRDLARMAEELGVPVVEDNTLANIVLGAPPPPPLAAFTRRGAVLSLGSMSKLFWAGLRIGWVRAGEAAMSRLVQQKVVADMGSSVPSQCLAAHVLAQSDKVLRTRRQQVGRILDVFCERLPRHLPGCSFTRPTGGLVLWVKLPHGDAAELAQVALRHGVSIVPGSLMSPEGGWADHVRFPLVAEEAVVREGLERLGRAWEAYASGGPRRAREMGVIV
jgi:DNA-binding transcriptional MocR family regulator